LKDYKPPYSALLDEIVNSRERIRELEKVIQNLMLEMRARTMRSATPITTNIVEMTVPDRVALLKEAGQ
jgi:hypothetical protein